MKKFLFLLTSLLSISCAVCMVGCNDKGDTGDIEQNGVQSRITTLGDENGEDTCPDCKENCMPKVRFDFKDGRPASKDGDGVEPPHERHHRRRPHPPKKPAPLPPEDGGQDQSEN